MQINFFVCQTSCAIARFIQTISSRTCDTRSILYFFSFLPHSVKKLHKALLLLPGANIFSLPNLERTLSTRSDNIISTRKFLANQMEMNFTWQIIEETSEKQTTVCLKNSRYFIAQSGIDLKSSVQLIFDVFAQLIEVRFVWTCVVVYFYFKLIYGCIFWGALFLMARLVAIAITRCHS